MLSTTPMNTKVAVSPMPASLVTSALIQLALRPRRSIRTCTFTSPASGPTKLTCAERSGGRSSANRCAATSASADDSPPYEVRPCIQFSGISAISPVSVRRAATMIAGRLMQLPLT